MDFNLSERGKTILYTLTGATLLYFGIVTLVCYDAGKHGFANIDWFFVLKSNFPLMIISASFFYQALKIKKRTT